MSLRLLGAAADCALLVSACGEGPKPTGVASHDSQFALAQCMRAHGVPNFPDPTKGPGGQGFSVTMSPGSSVVTIDGIGFGGPAFDAADRSCHFLGGGGSPPAITEAQKQALVAKAQCIRAHGVPNFPDPLIGPGGHGIGIRLPPGLNTGSPAFKGAANACQRIGAPIPHVPA